MVSVIALLEHLGERGIFRINTEDSLLEDPMFFRCLTVESVTNYIDMLVYEEGETIYKCYDRSFATEGFLYKYSLIGYNESELRTIQLHLQSMM